MSSLFLNMNLSHTKVNKLTACGLWVIMVSPSLSCQSTTSDGAPFWMPHFNRFIDTREDSQMLQIGGLREDFSQLTFKII